MQVGLAVFGEVLTLLALVVGALGFRRSICADRDTHIANYAVLVSTVSDMKTKLDKETGGNSGGLREAINAIGKKQEDIKIAMDNEARKSEVISAKVHELVGSAAEHRFVHERKP